MSHSDYAKFLESKALFATPVGIEVSESDLNPHLFPFQKACTKYSLKLGKAALFEECGLGKSLQELSWAEQVVKHTKGRVLLITHLAVAPQFIKEGEKFGIQCEYHRGQESADKSKCPIVVTNRDVIAKFDSSKFDGVILDESDILANYTGKTKQQLIEQFKNTPFKLAASATPAPNDHLELGNHSEFLDVLASHQMIQRWFTNDTMKAGGYKLKQYGAKDFWRWVASWAVCISKPSDIGYSDDGYILPELNIQTHTLAVDHSETWEETGKLVRTGKLSATEMHREMRLTARARAELAREIFESGEQDTPWLIWCNTDYEAAELVDLFPDAYEVKGSHSIKEKEIRLNGFSEGAISQLIVKPSIAGFGVNWQHCNNMIFVGLSHSFKQLYQSIRRSWRFGQSKPVNVHIISAETEGSILDIIKTKQQAHAEMQRAMNQAMGEVGLNLQQRRGYDEYNPQKPMILPAWLTSKSA